MKKRTFKSFAVIIVAAVIGLIFAFGTFGSYNSGNTYAYTSVQLLYDGAANGIDPNGNKFCADDIISEDNIKNALEELGWSDKYDVAEIKKNLKANGTYPDKIVEQITGYHSTFDFNGARELTVSEYYPTAYDVVLYDGFSGNVRKSDIAKLLDAIVKAYEKSFYEKYSHKYNTETLDSLLSEDGHDYTHRITLLKTEIELIKNYSNALYELHPAFAFDGMTFRDISLKCSSLLENRLDEMNISISMNGLTSDSEALINEYSYMIESLEYDLAEKQSSLSAVTALVESYERDSTLYLSSGDDYIKVQSNSGETYDALAEKKVSLASEISSINSKITEYRQRIADVKDTSDTLILLSTLSNNFTYVEEQIEGIKAQFDILSDKYDEKYVLSGSIELNEVKKSNNSIFSGRFIIICIKCIIPFEIIAVLVILTDFLIAAIKSEKKRRKHIR